MLKKDIEIINGILTDEIKRSGETFLIDETKSKGPYSTYSLIYPYTNDVLKEYEKEVIGKKVLTVAGSGDQALMTIKNGAEQVQMFDINRFALYYSNLKLAAVKALTYEEYIEFFTPQEDLFFTNYDPKIFNKILNELSEKEASLWSNIYTPLFCFCNYKLINECYSFDKSPIRYEEDYNTIKKGMLNCEILPSIETDLFEICSKLNNIKFDSIIFSNITSHLHTNDKYKLSDLLKNIEFNLEYNGIIQIAHYVNYQELYNGKKLSSLETTNFKKVFDRKHYLEKEKTFFKDNEIAYTEFYKKHR